MASLSFLLQRATGRGRGRDVEWGQAAGPGLS